VEYATGEALQLDAVDLFYDGNPIGGMGSDYARAF
jgi:hypothetical protein